MSRTAEPVKSGLTFEEFLEFEKTSSVKHEFAESQLFMVAGGTARHNSLAGRLYAQLLVAETDDCQVYFADVLVRTSDGTGYYPDVFVFWVHDADVYLKKASVKPPSTLIICPVVLLNLLLANK